MYIWARRIVIASLVVIGILCVMILLNGCESSVPSRGPGSVAYADSLKRIKGEVVAYKGEKVSGGYSYFYLFTVDGRKLGVSFSQYTLTSVGDTIHTEGNWN